jgi:hypothetical protein
MDDYVPLTQVLKDWFETPMAELPEDIQALAEEACFPAPWDKLSSAHRRDYAHMYDDEIQQRDAPTDPFRETEPDILGDLYAKETALEEDIVRWVAIPAPDAVALHTKEQRLKELRDELEDIHRQIATLVTAAEDALKVGGGDTATQEDAQLKQEADEPFLQANGRNCRAAVEKWVAWQARTLFEPNDTTDELADRILGIANRWGYESERRPMTIASITKMLPPGLTGGRGKNKGIRGKAKK